jgi:hypothetical protein
MPPDRQGKQRKSSQPDDAELRRLGIVPTSPAEARLERISQDMVPPDGFYSTTNHPTSILVDERWLMSRIRRRTNRLSMTLLLEEPVAKPSKTSEKVT